MPPPPHSDLYELARPLAEGAVGEGQRACRTLPFVALKPGSPAPDGVVAAHPRTPADRVSLLLGFDHLIAEQVDVINCSLGYQRPFDADDPLARATRAATELGVCVVVAAGNAGPREASMQELALAPWVISVGAVDANGAVLHNSSRGSASAPGPVVVADATRTFKPKYSMVVDFTHTDPDGEPQITRPIPQNPGTSFSAPIVSKEAAFIKKVLEATSRLIAACATQEGEPQPGRMVVPTLGFVDTGVNPDFLPESDAGPLRSRMIAGGQTELEIFGIDEEWQWCRAMAAALPDPDLAVTPEAVRRALVLSATPVAGDPWVVGAGIISRETSLKFLTDLTPSRLLAALAPDVAVPVGTPEGALWTQERMDILQDLFGTGMQLFDCRVV